MVLCTPDRGGGEFLVEARLKMNLAAFEKRLGAPEVEVVPAERRAPIARDEARRVEAGGKVALALHPGQTHERLCTGQENTARFERVFVVE